MRLSSPWIVVASAITFALVVSACGSDQPEAEPAAASEAESSAANLPIDIKVGREPNASFAVTGQDLGIHANNTQPELPTKSIRLNVFPTWASINPEPDVLNWADFDAIVAQAEQWGYTNIYYVFGATPEWAGTPVKGEDQSAFGPATAQPPKNLDVWRKYVAAVVERYKGRIAGYEVWNEPASPQFFTGTPKILAEMTTAAQEEIDRLDPGAYLLSAGAQTHREPYYDYFEEYLAELKKAEWPVDGIAVHLYPPGKGTPTTRIETIERVQDSLSAVEAPADLPIWDTEVNYDLSAEGGEPDGRISGQRAAAWTVATYLDGWRTGVRVTYWYIWTPEYYGFLGIQTRPGDPASLALATFGDWVIGSNFEGCDVEGNLVNCSFTGDSDFNVAYTTGGNADLALENPSEVCPVYGAECSDVQNSLKVGETPVRIVAS